VKKLFKENGGKYFRDTVYLIIGSILISVALNMFLLPCKIVLGGFTGIAMMFNYYWGLPVGAMTVALNVIPVIINIKLYGFRFLVGTIIGTVVSGAFTDHVNIWPVTTSDPAIASLIGGILIGMGYGMLFMRGFNTGGTDLIGWMVKSKLRSFSVAKLIFVADMSIIVIAAFITKSFDGLIYSFVATYITAKALDFTAQSISASRVAYIVSEQHEEIGERIFCDLKRNSTLLSGSGYKTIEQRHILMCAVAQREVFKLKEIVASCDKDAFVIISNTEEILGNYKSEFVKIN
jgi:uncharacterized membrane-anchored protein YitT (DUF2179 family)